MPVASLRSNQVASNDNMDSAKALIDKKVRNLEKRKVGITVYFAFHYKKNRTNMSICVSIYPHLFFI